MDEGEIDVWYDEGKEKALQDYLLQINSGDNTDDNEKKFKQRLADLRAQYAVKYEKYIKKKRRKDAVLRKVNALKVKILKYIPSKKK